MAIAKVPQARWGVGGQNISFRPLLHQKQYAGNAEMFDQQKIFFPKGLLTFFPQNQRPRSGGRSQSPPPPLFPPLRTASKKITLIGLPTSDRKERRPDSRRVLSLHPFRGTAAAAAVAISSAAEQIPWPHRKHGYIVVRTLCRPLIGQSRRGRGGGKARSPEGL